MTPKPRATGVAPPRSSEASIDEGRGVPLLDLESIVRGEARTRDEAVRTLREAFERFGFVRLSGHGVSSELLARVDDAFRRFFDQPEATRLRCSGVAGGQRGYTPFGREHARDRARADLKSFFHVGQPKPVGPSASEYPANVFPEESDDLERAALEVFEALEHAAQLVLMGVERGFGLSPGVLREMVRGGNSILRALHYPALSPEDFEAEAAVADLGGDLVLRAAPHEDINLVTLLPASAEAGLEILTRAGGSGSDAPLRWQPVRARPGEIVADVGDMLSRLTGGRLPSTTHRVVADAATATRPRTAYPFFAHPRPECDLSVRAEFVAPGHAAPFEPITAGDFLAERLREIGLVEPGAGP